MKLIMKIVLILVFIVIISIYSFIILRKIKKRKTINIFESGNKKLQFQDGLCEINRNLINEIDFKKALKDFYEYFSSKEISDTQKIYEGMMFSFVEEYFSYAQKKITVFEFNEMNPQTIVLLKEVILVRFFTNPPIDIITELWKSKKLKKLIITRTKVEEEYFLSYEIKE